MKVAPRLIDRRNTLPRSILLVFSRPVVGREEEFNRFQNDVHVHEVVDTPGFVAVQRFQIADGQPKGPGAAEAIQYGYLTIYDIDADDPADALAEFDRAGETGKWRMSDSFGGFACAAYTALTEPITPASRLPG